MLIKYKIVFILLAVCQYAAFSQCQFISTQEKESQAKSLESYFKYAGASSALYSGNRYKIENKDVKDHPFFIRNEWIEGNILYDGIWYKKVWLRYDLEKDMLLTTYNLAIVVELDRSKVDQFQIEGRSFSRIQHVMDFPDDGKFYEVISCGNASLLVHRMKRVEHIRELPAERYEFPVKDSYFIAKEGSLYQVRNKATVLKILEDQKAGIKIHLRNNRILFPENFEDATMKTIAHYNELTTK